MLSLKTICMIKLLSLKNSIYTQELKHIYPTIDVKTFQYMDGPSFYDPNNQLEYINYFDILFKPSTYKHIIIIKKQKRLLI